VKARNRRAQGAHRLACAQRVKHRHADGLHNNPGAERLGRLPLIEDRHPRAALAQQSRGGQPRDSASGDGDIVWFHARYAYHRFTTHLNEALNTMWHDGLMTHGIDPIAAPVGAQAQEQRQPQRHGPDFGGAMTHREAVQAALRVDPAAVTKRMAAPAPARADTERQETRQARMAAEDEAAADRAGQHVDIEV